MSQSQAFDSSFISLTNITKSFGDSIAVFGVSLDICKGEFFSLLGPSGCGKTTLMRVIAGFEQMDSGTLRIDGQDMAMLPPHQRPVNMMFQNYALFPHLSVESNIAFGLKQQKLDRDATRFRTAEMLALVQLTDFAKRKPDQLSGGQKQRVALARALARNPKVLLLDEPLAALDKKLRKETQGELKRIQASSGTTFIVVTHDQDEAMALSDRMAIMRDGKVVQTGKPSEIYHRPANRYVAGFIGDINLLSAQVASAGEGKVMAAVEGVQGTVTLAHEGALSSQEGLCLALRPERMVVSKVETTGCDHWMHGSIEEKTHLGATVGFRVRLDNGKTMQALVSAHSPQSVHGVGDKILIGFCAADAQLLGN